MVAGAVGAQPVPLACSVFAWVHGLGVADENNASSKRCVLTSILQFMKI